MKGISKEHLFLILSVFMKYLLHLDFSSTNTNNATSSLAGFFDG